MKPKLDSVKFLDIYNLAEENGNIAFIESGQDIPFKIMRAFYVFGVRVGDIRGHHAHKECKQFVLCPSGMVTITCDDGTTRKSYHLDSPLKGLYIPPMIWAEQFYHSNDSVLMCFSDKHFDENDYIRDYGKFKDSK